MFETTEPARIFITVIPYIILALCAIGIILKSIFYWVLTFSWNYLGREFCTEYNKNPPDGETVELDSLNANGNYFIAIYHFTDYYIPRMLDIDEEVFTMVLNAVMGINDSKEKALKSKEKEKDGK